MNFASTYSLLADNQIVFVAVAILLSVLLLAIAFFVAFLSMQVWLSAFLSGHPINLLQLIAMRFRHVDATEVVKQGVAAAHAGHMIPWHELERAWIAGVDLEKVTMAYCVSQDQGKDFTFAELVEADRESKLDDLLKGR